MGATEIPRVIQEHLPYWQEISVLGFHETDKLKEFIRKFINKSKPKVNGLVLVGGKSTRMGKDKIQTWLTMAKSQKDYMIDLLSPHCEDVYLSCNQEQAHPNCKIPTP